MANQNGFDFQVVRIAGDASDTYAAKTLAEALDLALPDAGMLVEEWEVTIPTDDAGAARLLPSYAGRHYRKYRWTGR